MTILELKQVVSQNGRKDFEPLDGRFSKATLLPRMVSLMESINRNI
jgi:hypothetical protein